jgi:hypothetical protein
MSSPTANDACWIHSEYHVRHHQQSGAIWVHYSHVPQMRVRISRNVRCGAECTVAYMGRRNFLTPLLGFHRLSQA